MLVKEYRVPMPFSVEEYKVGQLYMIARHSHEESMDGEGVEVIHNVPHEDDTHGSGRYTEKKIHLSSRLPYWLQAICPRVFYITEKSWNYYPYTETEYTCSFLPKLNIFIKTKYENNAGTTENCLDLTADELAARFVDHIDIAYDEVPPRKYKETEDPTFFKSVKTKRGPLRQDWKDTFEPIMCSYKLVQISFEVWGLQTKVEEYAHKAIRDILLLGHRQAFAWIDEWYDMTEEDVREYESQMQSETNEKLRQAQQKVVDGVAVETAAEVTDANAEAEVSAKGEVAKTSEDEEDGSEKAKEEAAKNDGNAQAGLVSGVKSWLGWA